MNLWKTHIQQILPFNQFSETSLYGRMRNVVSWASNWEIHLSQTSKQLTAEREVSNSIKLTTLNNLLLPKIVLWLVSPEGMHPLILIQSMKMREVLLLQGLTDFLSEELNCTTLETQWLHFNLVVNATTSNFGLLVAKQHNSKISPIIIFLEITYSGRNGEEKFLLIETEL